MPKFRFVPKYPWGGQGDVQADDEHRAWKNIGFHPEQVSLAISDGCKWVEVGKEPVEMFSQSCGLTHRLVGWRPIDGKECPLCIPVANVAELERKLSMPKSHLSSDKATRTRWLNKNLTWNHLMSGVPDAIEDLWKDLDILREQVKVAGEALNKIGQTGVVVNGAGDKITRCDACYYDLLKGCVPNCEGRIAREALKKIASPLDNPPDRL